MAAVAIRYGWSNENVPVGRAKELGGWFSDNAGDDCEGAGLANRGRGKDEMPCLG